MFYRFAAVLSLSLALMLFILPVTPWIRTGLEVVLGLSAILLGSAQKLSGPD